METTTTSKKFATDPKTVARRKKALNALKEQLEAGVKPIKGAVSSYTPEELMYNEEKKPIAALLTAKDIIRIKKEISILEQRVL